MKEEINEILAVLELDGDLAIIRNQLSVLNASRQTEIENWITRLNSRFGIDDNNDGLYYLFIACCHYEISRYKEAKTSILSASSHCWNNQVEKSIIHWLAGMIYNDSEDYFGARREISEAFKLIKQKLPVSSRIKNENMHSQRVKQIFDNRLLILRNTSLFSDIDEELNKNTYPLTDKQETEDKTPPIVVVNENYPANKFSVQVSSVSSENKEEREEELTDKNENRTDDSDFIYIQSLPVYNQKARAGKSGEIELTPKPRSYAEAQQIIIDDKLHNIHSLKSGTHRINITANASWGWMGVIGQSMEKANIQEGDYILFQYTNIANDNDVVIAHYQEKTSTTSQVIVKRYNKIDSMLTSETDKKGEDYDDMDIEEMGVQIIGAAYAVAKPIAHPP